MSIEVNNAFVQSYATNIGMLLQQQGSKLRGAVQVSALSGKAASVLEQFGAVNPVKNSSRHSDTPLISTPQSKRWVFPNDYDWADLIDDQDKLRMLIDPTSPYAMAGAWAMGRAQDDEIIAAFHGTARTGENGTTQEAWNTAYNVAQTVGATGNTGLNVAKLRKAKMLLIQAQVDIDMDPLFCAINGSEHDYMLNEAQMISLDYNTRPVLVEGKITAFMGFNFIVTERILTVATVVEVPVWAKSGMALGIWNDLTTKITERADKRHSTQVYVSGTYGATRLEIGRVVKVLCS